MIARQTGGVGGGASVTLDTLIGDGTKDMNLLGIAGPKMVLPSQVDPLYVEKPVGQYEPIH